MVIKYCVLGIIQRSDEAACGGGFYKAFNSTDYDVAYPIDVYANPTRVIGYARENSTGAITRNLVDSYSNITLPDSLEFLSKGITAYNRGANGAELLNKNWADILKSVAVPVGSNTSGKVRHGIWYSVSIRKDADSSKSLLRKYLWISQKDQIDPVTNLPVKDAQGNTIKVDFCFEYGESDWLAGTTWQSKLNNAKAGTGDVTCPN